MSPRTRRPRVAARLAAAAAGLLPVITADAGLDTPAPFSEQAVSRGIDYLTAQLIDTGQGLAFVDLDDDGDPDVVLLGRSDGRVGIYENDGTGHFTDRSASSGIPPLLLTSAVCAADYDRDGDLDLYVSRHGVANTLLRNDGSFAFTDVTASAGVGDIGHSGGSGWGDFDLDGWPDLYVANRTNLGSPVPNRFYRNIGNGAFEEIAAALGIDRGDDPTLQASFLDADRDGDADLYLATDKGVGCESNGLYNHLFENVGGAFVDVTESSGTAACVDAMCIAIGDFDGNREQDIYCTNTPPGNALLMNQGGLVFTQEEVAAGVASYEIGWGSVFFDYDNDGHLDLYVCNMLAENRMYVNSGTWPCTDLAAALGVNVPGDSFAVAAGDADLDGDLDLLVMTWQQKVRLFINEEGQARRWMRFDVVGEGPSRYAIGAIVDVNTGGVWRLREIVAGNNYKSQNELVAHVGVGDALAADAVTITWPGGTTRTIANLATNRAWTIYPPDKLGDADGDGDRDLDDFLVFAGCVTGDAPGALEPGCEVMDLDGDADVDLDDLDLFLASYSGTLDDCNDNGIVDLREIVDGSEPDENGNGILDSCEPAADIDGDGIVGFADLLILLAAWGEGPSPADIDGDGTVGFADLLVLLTFWG